MTIPYIPQTQLIPDSQVTADAEYGGLKIVRCQSDTEARDAYSSTRYEFQHELGRRHAIPGVVLGRAGAKAHYRLTATMHLNLRQFTEVVRYDPSNPPLEDYDALGMKDAHKQTQQDFKGAKKENLANYKQYLIEAIRGDRIAYLPTISGWQSAETFKDTIFVAFDEGNPNALYGIMYLPKKPVMQSDGQTQTGALFQAAATGLALKDGALDSFGITLEVELNVGIWEAGQSFADRNGRGSKKNKNLVTELDKSSAMAQLRVKAIEGTAFEGRVANGRTGGASETATHNIVDLSTLEQMLLLVIFGELRKPELIKVYHVESLLPYCREFFQSLDQTFAAQWPETAPKEQEPYFRRLYVHGWPFGLKALAKAFHDCHRDKIAPLAQSLASATKEEHNTTAEAKAAYLKAVAAAEAAGAQPPVITPEEFQDRLQKIDWHRYRKHWIDVTGARIDRETGKKKTRDIKDGKGGTLTIVEASAENTPAAVGRVASKILSPTWTDLTSDEDAK